MFVCMCIHICDVSSEKVPELPYVNIEKIANTRPKVNFAEFLFISLNDCLPTEEWFLRVWRKISNLLVVFELIASIKVSICHVFFKCTDALHHLPRNIHCFPQNRFESDSPGQGWYTLHSCVNMLQRVYLFRKNF